MNEIIKDIFLVIGSLIIGIWWSAFVCDNRITKESKQITTIKK